MAKEFPVGFKIIKEMSREELIDEIMDNQRAQAEEMETVNLRATVASSRIAEASRRIKAEAGIEMEGGLFGTTVREVDED